MISSSSKSLAELERVEKIEILEKFWEQRALSKDENQRKTSIDNIKNYFLLAFCEPGLTQKQWEDKLNKAWADDSAFKNKETFFKFFAHIDTIKSVGIAEELIELPKIINKPVTINDDKQKLLEDYIKERKLTVAAAVGSIKNKVKPICSENYKTSDMFSIQSITKVFTGLLALRMLEEGVITSDDLEKPSIKLTESATNKLENHPKILARLKEATLHQALTHHAGLGVGEGAGFGDYYSKYISAIDTALETKQTPPKVNGVEDFIQFIPNQAAPFGKDNYKYSNSGIVLAAMSLENLYNQHRLKHPEKKLEMLDFDGMMKKYVTGSQAANMAYFEPLPSPRMKVKHHKNDPYTIYMRGSPGGGYLSTVDDLQKFAQWFSIKCENNTFVELIKKYGQEFCPCPQTKTIEHTGDGPYNSGFFSLNWETGNLVIVLNDQRAVAASEVGRQMKFNILCEPTGQLKNEQAMGAKQDLSQKSIDTSQKAILKPMEKMIENLKKRFGEKFEDFKRIISDDGMRDLQTVSPVAKQEVQFLLDHKDEFDPVTAIAIKRRQNITAILASDKGNEILKQKFISLNEVMSMPHPHHITALCSEYGLVALKEQLIAAKDALKFGENSSLYLEALCTENGLTRLRDAKNAGNLQSMITTIIEHANKFNNAGVLEHALKTGTSIEAIQADITKQDNHLRHG